MNYLKKNFFRLSLSQRIASSIVILLLLCLELYYLIPSKIENNTYTAEDINALKELESKLAIGKNNTYQSVNITDSLKPFNPNDYTLKDWENIGFTNKQAQTIINYKKIVGGNFTSKEQLKKCYAISEDAFNKISNFLIFDKEIDNKISVESKKINYKKFNPNNYSTEDWENIGFTNKQAQSILKYKQTLGGYFTTKEQIKRCFVISDEKFREISNYIIFDTDNIKPTEKVTINNSTDYVIVKEKFNPNLYNLQDWINLGFTEKQAQTILNFKKSLGGSFKDAKTLSKSYAISKENFSIIEPFLIFD